MSKGAGAVTLYFSLCQSFSVASPIATQDAASHEVQVHEGRCQGDEQGRHDKRACNQARVEAGSVLRDHQQPGVRTMFGKEVKVKAKPAKTVVKAFAVAALKK